MSNTAGASHEQNVASQGAPHGKHITEVSSFDSNAPNASFNQEIGTENDPARAGIQKGQEVNVPSAGVQGDRGSAVENENKFAATGGDASA